MNYVTGQPIECVQLDEAGDDAMYGAVDFRAGTLVFVEWQRRPGDPGVPSWLDRWVDEYRERGWRAEWVTLFQATGHDGIPGWYVTLNLPRL